MNNNDILLKKGLPSSPDSEMMVISALVNDPRTTLEILTEHEIDSGHFTIKIYNDLRLIVSEIIDAGYEVDTKALTSALKNRKYDLQAIGETLADMYDNFVMALNIKYHLDNVILYHSKRELIRKSIESIKRAYRSLDINDFEVHSNGRVLNSEIENYITVIEGEFDTNELDRELMLTSKKHKNSRSKVLNRLVKSGVIERIGRRSGNYRKIEHADNVIDWKNATADGAIDIKLPFNIDELAYIFPKNIIVIAGEKDAGKTAFLLNVVKENMNQHKIVYLSSEMMAHEMSSRLSKFDDIKKDDWNFIPLECSSNFQDYIDPDSINLIDYLEVTDEFWKVGESIRKIYDRLDKGIAIIGLQKKKGAEYARGAEFSMEKARLYISLKAGNPQQNSELKIISAKNPKGDKPPRGLTIEYKLVQGCKFMKQNKSINDIISYKQTTYELNDLNDQ